MRQYFFETPTTASRVVLGVLVFILTIVVTDRLGACSVASLPRVRVGSRTHGGSHIRSGNDRCACRDSVRRYLHRNTSVSWRRAASASGEGQERMKRVR